MLNNICWGKAVFWAAVSVSIPDIGYAEQNDASAKDSEASEPSSNWHASIGIKLHPNRITGTTGFPLLTTAGAVFASDSVRTGTELTPILLGSVRYRNFFVSASHFLDTDYDAKLQQSSVTVSVNDRNETDINIGYYVLPSLSLSIGYKEMKYGSDLGAAKYSGPFVGVSGFGSLGSGFGLYGSFAYGAVKIDASAVPDGAKNFSYINYEGGLAYSFDFRERGGFLNALTITLGYRYQNIESKNAWPSQLVVDSGGGVLIPLGPPSSVHVSNTSQGPVLGLIISF